MIWGLLKMRWSLLKMRLLMRCWLADFAEFVESQLTGFAEAAGGIAGMMADWLAG